ncbi:MAG TPA: DUF1674 domain-containing protein [Chiayiivirga sp.]|nr:DUF1674 domain-containing protein [Chiayiivirga sp.]HRO28011.1 DUF1674 domain-containing protein [Luteimonas sp.]HRP73852.1 DUF1674 domain-containing protein [Luteimonas sp.]
MKGHDILGEQGSEAPSQRLEMPVAKMEAADAGGSSKMREVDGREGPDPTRYGDWEKNGRCIDF